MAIYVLRLPAILSGLFFLLQSSALLPQSTYPVLSSDQAGGGELICELQALKLSVARLESILEESIQNAYAKSIYLEEHEKLIEELSLKIKTLESTLFNVKEGSSHIYKKLNSLEEEVRLLWSSLRKNNFDIHVLQSKEKEARDRLDVVSSTVEQLADIVSEQWIQIQQQEQAVQMTQKRTLDIQKRLRSSKCTFSKVRDMFSQYLLSKKQSTSYVSNAFDQSRKAFEALKNYHHQLQGFIRKEMEGNEITAGLSNSSIRYSYFPDIEWLVVAFILYLLAPFKVASEVNGTVMQQLDLHLMFITFVKELPSVVELPLWYMMAFLKHEIKRAISS